MLEINTKLRYYSFRSTEGVSSLTFEEVSRRIVAYSAEMHEQATPNEEGTAEHFYQYICLLGLATSRWQAHGVRLLCDLNKQLAPFMGQKVLVRDEAGERRISVVVTYGVVPMVAEVWGGEQTIVPPTKVYQEVKSCR